MSEKLKRFAQISIDLHSLIVKRAQQKKYTQSEILGWLTATLVGTCEQAGYLQELFNETCDLMKINFAEKREERNRKNPK